MQNTKNQNTNTKNQKNTKNQNIKKKTQKEVIMVL